MICNVILMSLCLLDCQNFPSGGCAVPSLHSEGTDFEFYRLTSSREGNILDFPWLSQASSAVLWIVPPPHRLVSLQYLSFIVLVLSDLMIHKFSNRNGVERRTLKCEAPVVSLQFSFRYVWRCYDGMRPQVLCLFVLSYSEILYGPKLFMLKCMRL